MLPCRDLGFDGDEVDRRLALNGQRKSDTSIDVSQDLDEQDNEGLTQQLFEGVTRVLEWCRSADGGPARALRVAAAFHVLTGRSQGEIARADGLSRTSLSRTVATFKDAFNGDALLGTCQPLAPLRDMEKDKGGRPVENRSHDVTGFARLEDIGVSKKQSSRWQKLASVPEEQVAKRLARMP